MSEHEEVVRFEAILRYRDKVIRDIVSITIPPYTDERERAKCIYEAMILWQEEQGLEFGFQEITDEEDGENRNG